jgi:hypothetical protein
MPNVTVLTTANKEKRNELFRALRISDVENERAVVRFSGIEPVVDSEGKQIIDTVQYSSTGKKQFRPRWQSNWSVAYLEN